MFVGNGGGACTALVAARCAFAAAGAAASITSGVDGTDVCLAACRSSRSCRVTVDGEADLCCATWLRGPCASDPEDLRIDFWGTTTLTSARHASFFCV